MGMAVEDLRRNKYMVPTMGIKACNGGLLVCLCAVTVDAQFLI